MRCLAELDPGDGSSSGAAQPGGAATAADATMAAMMAAASGGEGGMVVDENGLLRVLPEHHLRYLYVLPAAMSAER